VLGVVQLITGTLPSALPLPRCFVLGHLHSLAGQYLVAIAERQEVGYINNAAIYKMAKALVVAIPRQCEYWSEEEVRTSGSHHQFTTHPLSRSLRSH
jgi:hypothetical protein